MTQPQWNEVRRIDSGQHEMTDDLASKRSKYGPDYGVLLASQGGFVYNAWRIDELEAVLASERTKVQRLEADAEAYAQLQARCFDYGGTFQNVFDDLREAKVNARRYLWLREPSSDISFMFHLSDDGKPIGILARELLDAAIDAAIDPTPNDSAERP
jgi:hypothetical protein